MKKKFNSVQEAISFYESYFAPSLLHEFDLCCKAVRSATANDEEKAEAVLMASSHQWHLIRKPRAKAVIIAALAKEKLWERTYEDFEDVYGAVSAAIGKLDQAGLLTLYDVAKRIGYSCGVEPEAYVYLHSGALTGAKNLFGNGKLSCRTMERERFEKLLPGLSALHIENFLCIMKSFFVDGKFNPDAEIIVKGCKPGSSSCGCGG